jgi:predicted Fe-Mo cluster-binding NifX family protein
MAIFTLEGAQVVEQTDVPLQSRDPFDRVRLLRDQQVDTIICGGVQGIYEDALRASGMHVISWVSGAVDDLLALFVAGRLTSGKDPDEPHGVVPAAADRDARRRGT